jgi:hypothetical protein
MRGVIVGFYVQHEHDFFIVKLDLVDIGLFWSAFLEGRAAVIWTMLMKAQA